jgi:hypothetical protein
MRVRLPVPRLLITAHRDRGASDEFANFHHACLQYAHSGELSSLLRTRTALVNKPDTCAFYKRAVDLRHLERIAADEYDVCAWEHPLGGEERYSGRCRAADDVCAAYGILLLSAVDAREVHTGYAGASAR